MKSRSLGRVGPTEINSVAFGSGEETGALRTLAVGSADKSFRAAKFRHTASQLGGYNEDMPNILIMSDAQDKHNMPNTSSATSRFCFSLLAASALNT